MADTWDSPSTGYTGGGPTSGPSTSYNGTTGDYGEYSDNGTGNNSGVGYGSTPSTPSTNYGGIHSSAGNGDGGSSVTGSGTSTSWGGHSPQTQANQNDGDSNYTVPSVYNNGGSVNATPVTYSNNNNSGGDSSPSWNGVSVGSFSPPKDLSFTLKETSSGIALSRAMEGGGGGDEFKLDIPSTIDKSQPSSWFSSPAFAGELKTEVEESAGGFTLSVPDFVLDQGEHLGRTTLIEAMDKGISWGFNHLVPAPQWAKDLTMITANSIVGNLVDEPVTGVVQDIYKGFGLVPIGEDPGATGDLTFGIPFGDVPKVDFTLDEVVPGPEYSVDGRPMKSITLSDFWYDMPVSVVTSTGGTLAAGIIGPASAAASGGNPLVGFGFGVGAYSLTANALTEPAAWARDAAFEAAGYPDAKPGTVLFSYPEQPVMTDIPFVKDVILDNIDPDALDPTGGSTPEAFGPPAPGQKTYLELLEEQARPNVVISEGPKFPGKDEDDGVISMPRPSIVVSSADSAGPKPRPDIQVSSADDDAPTARPTVTTKPATGSSFDGDTIVFNTPDTTGGGRPGSSMFDWLGNNTIKTQPDQNDGDTPCWLLHDGPCDHDSFDFAASKPEETNWDDYKSPLAFDMADFGRNAFGDSLI